MWQEMEPTVREPKPTEIPPETYSNFTSSFSPRHLRDAIKGVLFALCLSLVIAAIERMAHPARYCRLVEFEESPFWFVRAGPDCLYVTMCGADAIDYAAARASERTTYVDAAIRKAVGVPEPEPHRELGETVFVDMVLGKDLSLMHYGFFGETPLPEFMICESDRERCELRGHFVHFIWASYQCVGAYRFLSDAQENARQGRDALAGLLDSDAIRVVTREMTDLEHVHWTCLGAKPSLYL